MGLTFKLSRTNANKEYEINQLLTELSADEEIQSIYYLIPDNVKFESEVNVLRHLKETNQLTMSGMIDLQVYSFQRLAWHLLSDSSIFNQTRLSQTGLTILVKKIIIDIIEEDSTTLKVFKGQEQFNGFINKLTDVLMEFRNGLIEPIDLEQFLTELDPNTDTYRKLSDLRYIYQAFISEIAGKYIEREDIIKALIQKIESENFSKTVIVIDHYENFSSQELSLIETFMKKTKDVYICLTLDKAYPNNKPEYINLFYLSGKTYHKLFKIAQSIPKLAIKTEEIKFNLLNNPVHEDLLAVEKYWYQMYGTKQGIIKSNQREIERVKIAELLTIQDEIQYVTNRIRHLVAKENYRYKDILVVARQPEEYQNIVEPLFQDSHIPVFFNVKESMSHHPLVEYVTSLLRVVQNNFRYSDVLRFLRTELFIPEGETIETWRQKIDITENVILAYGYQGSAWTRSEDWVYARIDDEDSLNQSTSQLHEETVANEVRKILSDLFVPLIQKLTKESKSNRHAIEELYQFVEDMGVKETLLNWRDQALAEENIELSRKHEQAWQTLVNIIDEYIEVLGELSWDLDEFLSIIDMAFENSEYSIVPPTLDQVTVTSLTQVRANKSKVVFYIGMNESALPQTSDNNSILDDEDREFISERLALDDKKMLSPSTTENLAIEPFLAYQAFGFATDYMYFSYSVKHDGEADHSLSQYVEQLKNYLGIEPYIQRKLDVSIQSNITDDLEMIVGSHNQLLNVSVQVMRFQKDTKQPLHPTWALLTHYLLSSKQSNVQRILDSLNYKNIPYSLPKDLALELYRKDLHLSVSQLETFYKDPYNHFLKYGLGLKERKEFELTPAESGSFYHEILDYVVTKAIEGDKDFKELTKSDLKELTTEVVDQLLELPQYRVLTASEQMIFIRQLLTKTVTRRINMTQRQFKNSEMKPFLTEVNFGLGAGKKSLPPFRLSLNQDSSIYLRGKIDRIDLMPRVEDSIEKLYMQIVDYKSSEMKIDYSKLRTGLSLQLLTYFDAALTLGVDLLTSGQNYILEPFAALYSLIQTPTIKSSDIKNSTVEELISKKMKYAGLLIDNQDALIDLDTELSDKASGNSNYYGLKKLKSEKYNTTGRDRLITKEELALFLKHNRALIKQSGRTILSGELQMSPYYGVDYIDTLSGEYHAISQFDVILPENNYRYLPLNYNFNSHINFLNNEYGNEGAQSDSES